jgi:hypothetical protein
MFSTADQNLPLSAPPSSVGHMANLWRKLTVPCNITQAAVLIWGFLVVGVAAYGYLYPHVHTVYDVYASASRNWWAGTNPYLYRPEYRYSPLFAIAVTPFTLFPDRWGNAFWKATGALAYAGGLSAFVRAVCPCRLSPAERAAFSLFALPTALISLYNGQANMVMLAAMLTALAALARGRWNQAAAWMALATLIKGYPIGLGLLLALLFPRSFAIRYGAALALGLLVPWATQSLSVTAACYQSWFGHLTESTHLWRWRSRALDYLFVIAGHPLPPNTFAWMGIWAGAAVACVCLARGSRTATLRARLKDVLALFSVWVLLFGPATEASTYAMAAPPLAWALVDPRRRRGARWTDLLLVSSLLLMGPLCTDLVSPSVHRFMSGHGGQPIGALLFLGYLVTERARSGYRASEGGKAGDGALEDVLPQQQGCHTSHHIEDCASLAILAPECHGPLGPQAGAPG